MDDLIFDRTTADVQYALELNNKLYRGEALTTEESAAWNAGLKGAYNASDMNRVDSAVRELGSLLAAAGYAPEYTNPHAADYNPSNLVLTSDDFQVGCYQHASGTYQNASGYICTKGKLLVAAGVPITVSTGLTLSTYSGFCWYDIEGTFISGTVGGAPLQSGGSFTAIPPTGAYSCHVNINSNGVTPSSVDDVVVTWDYAELPEGYKQIEYLQSDGGQYINTDFIPLRTDGILVIMDGINNPSLQYWALFGARTNNNTQFWSFYDRGQSSWNGRYASTNQSISKTYAGQHAVSLMSNRFKVDDTTMTFMETTFTVGQYAYLFAHNNAGTAQYQCAMRLYAAKLYRGSTLAADLVPVVNSDGEGGLYDVIRDRFFVNSGTGSFTLGGDVADPEFSVGWQVGDVITQPVWEQYLANVQALRDAYYALPDSPALPEPTAPLTYAGANAIERLIYDISSVYQGMVMMYRISGTFKSGNNVVHLPLQRGTT